MADSGQGPLLVLDIDGVMIEAEASYAEALARALGDLAPGMAWGLSHYRAFKARQGFNNDFRLAAAALLLGAAGRLEAVLDPGADLGLSEARLEALEPLCRSRVQFHYGHTRRLEAPLIAQGDLAAWKGPQAIFTGRPPEELGLAFEVLGFELPAVCDSEPALRKPEPGGLLLLAERFGARAVLFVGDSPDDAAALRAARGLRPDLDWTFAAVGPARARIAEPGDLQAPTLKALLGEAGEGAAPGGLEGLRLRGRVPPFHGGSRSRCGPGHR